MKAKKFWRVLFTNVRHKYRFSVTDESFHEKFSFRLSGLNVLTVVACASMLLMAATVCLVVFTPLKKMVPGYVKREWVESSLNNRLRIDSLQSEMEAQSLMLRVLTATLSGEIPVEESIGIKDSLKQYDNLPYRISVQDSLLRREIETSDRYVVETPAAFLSGHNPTSQKFSDNLLFYKPVQGTVISHFDYKEQHFGIDIETESNAVIKSVLDGNVVFSSWSPDRGYILLVEHEKDLISLYSAASALFKRAGDFVRAGEAIGIAGSSTEHGTDYLHFELWYNGSPVDPEKYLIL
ncbi:M23 family metallopeptidase [bacterium]|nr:M23 family metallopeptidase [bacterium]